jgi:flagellar biosynthesis protein FlhF
MRRDVPRRGLPPARTWGCRRRAGAAALGDDVVVLNTRSSRDPDGVVIEVVARGRRGRGALPGPASEGRGARLPRVLCPRRAHRRRQDDHACQARHHRDAFAHRRPALVTLDTYRAGAVAQLETYAHVARLPFDVVADARDAERVRDRLRDAGTVLVDTPGRGPRTRGEDPDAWRAALDALAPDEVHLVIPATMRADLAEAARERHDAVRHARR